MRMYKLLLYYHMYPTYTHTHFANTVTPQNETLFWYIHKYVRSQCSQNIYLLNSIKLINVAWLDRRGQVVDTGWQSRYSNALAVPMAFLGQHQRAFNMLNCFLVVKSFFSVNPFVCLIFINTTTIIYLRFILTHCCAYLQWGRRFSILAIHKPINIARNMRQSAIMKHSNSVLC